MKLYISLKKKKKTPLLLLLLPPPFAIKVCFFFLFYFSTSHLLNQNRLLKVLVSSVPNAKHLTFGTLRPKDLSQLLNAKKFSMNEQYHFKFETVRTQMLNQKKKKKLLFFSLLSIMYLIFSLSSHISVSLPFASTFLSTLLSPLSLSQPLSLSLSSSLTSRQSLPTTNLAMVSASLKATHLATVSLALYMFLDFN